MQAKTIRELEKEIRGYINQPRKQHQLLGSPASWNMLCSCLDVIGDTQLALEAYHEAEEASHAGDGYLMVFGVLQILFVQQDAIDHLCEALDVEYEAAPSLGIIREVRNDSVGHPTKRGGGRGKSYNFISRHTLTREGFDLMKTFPDETKPEFQSVNIPDLIRKQREPLQEALTTVVEKLRREEAEHRQEHREQKLQDAFPQTIRYHFSKVYEAILGSKPSGFGAANLKTISDSLLEFKNLLESRGTLEAYDSMTLVIDELEYSIAELGNYFSNPEESYLNDKSANIFCFFAEDRMGELEDMAEEIDEVYAEEP